MGCVGGVIKICSPGAGDTFSNRNPSQPTSNSGRSNNSNSTSPSTNHSANPTQTTSTNTFTSQPGVVLNINFQPSIILNFSTASPNPTYSLTSNYLTQTPSVTTYVNYPNVIGIGFPTVVNTPTPAPVNSGYTVSGTEENVGTTQAAENSNRVNRRIINLFLNSALENVGAIKTTNDPVRYALNRIRNVKSVVDSLISNLQDKFQRIHIYEEVRKNENFYGYSSTAESKKLKIHTWIKLHNDTINYSLDVQSKRAKIHEWFSINNSNNEVKYSMDIQTKKLKIHEFFQNTETRYIYSLDIKRA